MVQQGSQLSEWTECLRTPAVLWQWPQGLQLSEWTEDLRTPAMLWQYAQGVMKSMGYTLVQCRCMEEHGTHAEYSVGVMKSMGPTPSSVSVY